MLTLNFSIDKGASFMVFLLKLVYDQTHYFGHSRSKQRTDQRVLVLTLKFLALKKLVFPP